MWRVLADAVLIGHLAFVLFVVGGGALVLRWPRLAWLHLPAAAWGVAIEFGGWICPLTPLENHLRQLAGQAAYEGDFIARYLLAVLYPQGLTREIQWLLGSAVLVINAVVYAIWLQRRRLAAGAKGNPRL
jgi:uncharacterized membrane protein YhhN